MRCIPLDEYYQDMHLNLFPKKIVHAENLGGDIANAPRAAATTSAAICRKPWKPNRCGAASWPSRKRNCLDKIFYEAGATEIRLTDLLVCDAGLTDTRGGDSFMKPAPFDYYAPASVDRSAGCSG